MEEMKNFDSLGLSPETVNAVKQKGFEEPTEVQAMTIPVMLNSECDIIAQAQTGTGKTAAFGLPLIDTIEENSPKVQALILAPTRELAVQVSEEIVSLRGNKKLSVVPVYGGQSIDQQLRRLKRGAQIVVGTPGRIIDHLKRKTLDLSDIKFLILDEADEMLNMGFVDDMEEIMKHTGKDKRTLLFSATMPDRIKNLAEKYMRDYEHISVKKKQLTTALTEQIYFEVKGSDKFEALCRIVDIEEAFYGIVFCRTKNDVDTITAKLTERGYDAEAIHGDITQVQRERTLGKFKMKSVNILVATDVAARGIDVNDLTHVINYSLPQDPESYVHRIGRTGRAGKQGTAVTFITPSEYKKLMFIQRIAKADIKKQNIPAVREIIKTRKKKIQNDLKDIIDGEIDEKFQKWSEKLLEDNSPSDIVSALLQYSFEESLSPEGYGEIKGVKSKEKFKDLGGKARLFVALGKRDKYSPKKIVTLITERVDIKSRDIDDIQVMENFAFVTVPYEKAEEIISVFKEKGKRPLFTHAKEGKKKGSGKKRKGRNNKN